MKKKNLQLRLNLTKETVLSLSAKDGVKGGKVPFDPVTNDCARTFADCPTQGHASQCCPGCRSGCNATMVKELCDVVLLSVDMARTCLEPADL